MTVVVLTTLVGLAAVAAALWRDEPVAVRGAQGVRPRWEGLPEPADLARVAFPTAVLGYDPASVDVHFEALFRAYEDLWSVAPDEVRQRARMRADGRAMRQASSGAEGGAAGGQWPAAGTAAGGAAGESAAVVVPEPPDLGETDAEALAAEAALSRLERDGLGRDEPEAR